MSFFTFNIIANAIDAYQQATNVTSDNVANVATPGASRQSAVVTEAIPISGSPFYAEHLGQPGTRGEGAVVNQIARIHQDSYDTLFRGATSSQSFYTTEQQQLGTLQSNFGEPNNGINSAYAALQTAISNSTSSPTSVAVRQAVLTQAQTFATALNSSSAAVTQQETTAKSEAASVVTKANTYIDQIAALNGQIRALKAVGDNPNTYLDQRDYAIDQLSQILPTSTALQSNGSSLVSVAGRPLVNDTVTYHISGPVIGQSADGTPTFVFGFVNDSNPSNPAPIPLGSGRLGAFADLYNNKLVPYGRRLDNFASSVETEMNRITQAGVDLNGNAGTALFTPGNPISAGTISVAITDPTQVPLGLISTNAGGLTRAMNSANNTVSTLLPIDGNVMLSNPPASAGFAGTLTINVDGTAQTFKYATSTTAVPPTVPPGNADTINGFMTNFNAGHFGVTASYDASTQTIGFTRDPNNIDAVHRGLQGSHAPTDGFTISDSLGPAGTTPPSAASPQGTPATGLLQALGATNINGIAQTPLNAYGSADNGAANALVKLFTQPVGVGALQTTAAAIASGGPYLATITAPAGNPGAFSALAVGNPVTIVNAATGTSQTDLVTAVSAGIITVSSTAPIGVNDSLSVLTTTTVGAASPAPTSVGAASPVPTTVGAVSSATAGLVTVTPPAGSPGAFATVNVGDSLNIGGTNEPVTAIDRATGTVTVNASVAIAVGQPVSLAAGLVTVTPPAGSPSAFASMQVGDTLLIGGTKEPVTSVDLATGTITVNASVPIAVGDPISLTAGAVTVTPPASYPGAFVTVNVGDSVSIAGNSDVVTAVDRATGAITVNTSVAISAGNAVTNLKTGVGAVSTGAPYTVTIPPPAGTPGAFLTIDVGQVLTIVNAVSGTQQSAPVTAVDRNTGTITVSASQPVNVGDPITTAQTQTLGAAYQGLVTQMGLDMTTANAGEKTQSALSASIDQARQSVDGINVDEETQNLIKFQSAYTAAAKTLSILNTMMQTTLGLISGG